MASYSFPNYSIEESTTGTPSLFSYVTPLNYLLFLTASLLCFLAYLILPMGIRAQYCGAGRRRYRRQGRLRKKVQQPKPPPQRQSFPEDILGNVYAYSHSFSPQEQVDQLFGGGTTPSSSDQKLEIMSSQASALDSVWGGVEESHSSEISASKSGDERQRLSMPQMLKEMLKQPPGIRFVAHGTKCRPRPVWITLHCGINSQSTPLDYQNCLTWRAELKTHKTSPMTSPGPKMGNLRRVELNEVLGIEKGKRTTALRRVQTAKAVNEHACFSLLTKTGTLDLECTGLNVAGNQLSPEQGRAAFITCLAMAMSSKGLRLNGLRPSNSSSPLQSQLDGLNHGSPASHVTTQWDENTLFSILVSEAKTASTLSF